MPVTNNKLIGVSVLTIGPATGHNVTIDREGLSMSLRCLRKQTSVRLVSKHEGEVSDIMGKVYNFRIEGDQIKGDIDLFDHPRRAQLIEIAQKMPGNLGLSIESEYAEGPLFRPKVIDAIAVVTRPASNRRGLFGALRAVATREPRTFSEAVEQKRQAGSKYAFTAAVAAFPELYTKYVESHNAGSGSRLTRADRSRDYEFEQEVSHQMKIKKLSRPQAIVEVSRVNPGLYNAARASNWI